RTGVRAVCSDCHVPKAWTYKMMRKIQASREVWGKLTGTIDTREKFEAKRLTLARSEWARMKSVDSRECRNCHSFESMNKEAQKQRARKQHEMAVEDKMTCIDCHKGIAHHKPEGMTEEDEEEDPSCITGQPTHSEDMTMKKTMIAGAVGALLTLGTGSALAAAPDWGKVEGKDI